MISARRKLAFAAAMKRIPFVACMSVSAVVAFLVGAHATSTGAADATLHASPQDRQPPPPPPGSRRPTPPTVEAKTAPAPLVYGGDSGSAASANGILAVTGSYGVGTSVLYLIDTNTKQLAVYEARGGSPNSRRLFLVGARRIDLDLQLEGYNDESEFSYQALKREFETQQRTLGTGARPTIAPRVTDDGDAGDPTKSNSSSSTSPDKR